MLYDLASLAAWREWFIPTYIIAETDHGSRAKADAFEQQQGRASARVVRVPRAREVGQSYFTSIFTTLRAMGFCLRLVLADPPDVVLTNGPGTCVPIVFAAYVARVAGLRHVLVMYSESFACVHHLSLSGKLMYRFSDCFTVQWPQLLAKCSRAEYAGRLHSTQDSHRSTSLAPLTSLPPLVYELAAQETPTAIVTVGSTRFDDLIRAIDDSDFLSVLRHLNISKLKVQRGAGQYRLSNLGSEGQPRDGELQVEVVDYVPDLPSQLQRAALVISHAGAGTILDCLSAGRRLVVVPNESLMANHQVQLGIALQEQRLLFCFHAGELVQKLREADFGLLRRFPEGSGATFARCVQGMLGIQLT